MHILQGHIALDALVFPEGTLGSRIDCVARLALWQQGLDYNHGTGHGVGSYLNVHEGPQGIGFRRRVNEEVQFFGSIVLNIAMCQYVLYAMEMIFPTHAYTCLCHLHEAFLSYFSN